MRIEEWEEEEIDGKNRWVYTPTKEYYRGDSLKEIQLKALLFISISSVVFTGMFFAASIRCITKPFKKIAEGKSPFLCLAHQIRALAQVPLYILKLTLAAVYTLYHPLYGRRWVAEIEKQENDQKPLNDTCLRKTLYIDSWFYAKSFFTDPDPVFFLMECFQSRGIKNS